VLWWECYEDGTRGRAAAGLFDRCRATDTCPLIFETFGAAKFNARLITAPTGTFGHQTLPPAANVRRNYFPGTMHDGNKQGGFARAGWLQDLAPAPGRGAQLRLHDLLAAPRPRS
jgi:hypothetical protein